MRWVPSRHFIVFLLKLLDHPSDKFKKNSLIQIFSWKFFLQLSTNMYTPFLITHLPPIFWFVTIRFERSWGSFHTKLSLCCQMGWPYSYVKKKILIVSLRKGLALHLTNVNFLPQRILYAKFGLNWLSVSREDIKKEKKKEKKLHTDWRQTKSDHNSSLELSALVSKNKKGFQTTN